MLIMWSQKWFSTGRNGRMQYFLHGSVALLPLCNAKNNRVQSLCSRPTAGSNRPTVCRVCQKTAMQCAAFSQTYQNQPVFYCTNRTTFTTWVRDVVMLWPQFNFLSRACSLATNQPFFFYFRSLTTLQSVTWIVNPSGPDSKCTQLHSGLQINLLTLKVHTIHTTLLPPCSTLAVQPSFMTFANYCWDQNHFPVQ